MAARVVVVPEARNSVEIVVMTTVEIEAAAVVEGRVHSLVGAEIAVVVVVVETVVHNLAVLTVEVAAVARNLTVVV